jgi:hypothetical protein
MDEYEKFLEKHITTCDHIDIGTGRRAMLDMALNEYRAFKAKDKAEEPLAVLADRKGWWLARARHFNDRWVLNLDCETLDIWTKCEDLAKPIVAPTYPECEAKARAFLMGLPDREGN